MEAFLGVLGLAGIIVSIIFMIRKKSRKKWLKVFFVCLAMFIAALIISFTKPKENTATPSTDVATETPTETAPPTEEKTETPTEIPTEVPTEAPTEVPTEVPTVEPTEVPTEVPTVELTPEPVVTDEPVTQSVAEPVYFILSWDDSGEYGTKITLNANTDMPYELIKFFVPAGIYDVANKGTQKSVQVTVYNDKVNKVDGWEEFDTENCANPIVIFQNEDPKEIEVKEGQFIKLSDGGNGIEFSMKKR